MCLCGCHSVPLCCGAAPYFEKCISEQDLDEVHIEIIRNTLYKVVGMSGHLLYHTATASFCAPPPSSLTLRHTSRTFTGTARSWVGPRRTSCALYWRWVDRVTACGHSGAYNIIGNAWVHVTSCLCGSLKQIAEPSSSPSTRLGQP